MGEKAETSVLETTYSNVQIVLGDLISNSIDALDSVRHELLIERCGSVSPHDLVIEITINTEEKSLTVSDNGIGISRASIVDQIANTKNSLEVITRAGQDNSNSLNSGLVSFHSAFLVAKKLIVTTKHKDDQQKSQYVLQLDSESLTVREDTAEPSQLNRGTSIKLYMNETLVQNLDVKKIREIVNKISQFSSYIIAWQVIDLKDNDILLSLPIWTKYEDNLKKEEYDEFYKFLTKKNEDYLSVTHFNNDDDGLKLNGLLYIPKNCSYDSGENKHRRNIKLYKCINFIADDCNFLIPEYLGFVKGVVDSEYLPYNILHGPMDRDEVEVLNSIQDEIVNQCFEMLFDQAVNKESYTAFYKMFGQHLLMGIETESDMWNRKKLYELLRFCTSTHKDELSSLREIASRLQKDESKIFVLNSCEEEEKYDFVERLKKQHKEIIFSPKNFKVSVWNEISLYVGKNFKLLTKDDLV